MTDKEPWLGEDILWSAEAALPGMIADGPAHWESLVSELPDGAKIERLYRAFKGYDIFLIRVLHPTLPQVFSAEPVRGSSVGRILQGECSLGVCDPRQTESPLDHLLMVRLKPGVAYVQRAGTRLSWKQDSSVSLHIIVADDAPTLDSNPATPQTVADILSQFGAYYRP